MTMTTDARPTSLDPDGQGPSAPATARASWLDDVTRVRLPRLADDLDRALSALEALSADHLDHHHPGAIGRRQWLRVEAELRTLTEQTHDRLAELREWFQDQRGRP